MPNKKDRLGSTDSNSAELAVIDTLYDHWYNNDHNMCVYTFPQTLRVSTAEFPEHPTQLHLDQFNTIIRALDEGQLLYRHTDADSWTMCDQYGQRLWTQCELWRIADFYASQYPPKFVPKLRPALGFRVPAVTHVQVNEGIEVGEPEPPASGFSRSF